MRVSLARSKPRREDGQILVIFAGGLLVLMLIAALVIDLGFAYMVRRQEQDAVDPAAVAAARYLRTGAGNTAEVSKMWDAACFYALKNAFRPTQVGGPNNNQPCDALNPVDGSSITVNWPPSANAGPRFVGGIGFVEVILNRPHQSFFSGLIGMPTIGITSSAVGAFDIGNSNSNSLVALDPGGCNGNPAGFITGGGTVQIDPAIDPGTGNPYDGGYVHINSSCGTATADDQCLGGQGALQVGGGGHLQAPKTYIVGACSTSGIGATVNTVLDEGSIVIGDPMADLPPPSFGPPGGLCGDASQGDPTPITQTTQAGAEGCDFKKKDQTYHINPGVYYGGWKITGQNVTLHLNPGVYVIAGGGIDLGATGTITSIAGVSGPAPVMIFSTDDPQYAGTCMAGGGSSAQCQNKINFSAGSDLLLAGLTSGPYKGMLIWQDGKASGAARCPDPASCPRTDVNLSGQTSLTLTGTIYNAKGVVTVDGGGIGNGYASVQIISWRWKLSGSGTLHMPYDPTLLYHFDSKGLVR